MRMFKLTLIALAALFAFSAVAEAIEVKKRREASGTPEAVWGVVGDFCAIKDWHPTVVQCDEVNEGDDIFRILTLGDGGKIKERLTGKGDTSYSYEIVESPLPVKNYEATLELGEDDEPDRIEILWTSKFEANGVSDDEAKKIIVGIVEDGIKGIKKAALDLSDTQDEEDDDDDDE